MYSPMATTITVGQIVKFQLESSHNVAPDTSTTTDTGLAVDFGKTACLKFSKAGKVVYLYRYIGTSRTLVAKLTLNKYSQFSLSFRPARGTYVFRIYVPALTGNAAAFSAALTLYRT